MRNLHKPALLVFVIALWSVASISYEACAKGTSARSKETGPRIKEAEVVEIATKVAIKKGHDPKSYEILEVSYSVKDKNWLVHFNGNSRIIGDHFSVTVDDRNRTTRYQPGM